MTDSVIGISELHRSFKRIVDAVTKGKSFIVMRHSQPVFRIRPVGFEYAAKNTSRVRKINWSDPFENPFATFTEWNDPSNDIYDDLLKKKHLVKKGVRKHLT